MKKYTIRFMPEYFATSLWSYSDNSYKNFGTNIKYQKLNLSKELIEELEKFDDSVLDIVDWNNPGGGSPLSSVERVAIWNQGQILLARIRAELTDDFEVIDASDWVK